MKNDVQQELIALVGSSLARCGLAVGRKEDIYLELPTDNRFGDFTTNIALKLSKTLKKPPREIAATLVELIQKEIKLFNMIFLGSFVSLFASRFFYGFFHSKNILAIPLVFLLIPYFLHVFFLLIFCYRG